VGGGEFERSSERDGEGEGGCVLIGLGWGWAFGWLFDPGGLWMQLTCLLRYGGHGFVDYMI